MSVDRNTAIIGQVRKGMEVHTSDGHKLGKVAAVWYGTDPSASSSRCDEDICSRLEVHHGLLGHEVLYVPYNAIKTVASDQVQLNVDATTANEHDWTKAPGWIAGADDSLHPDKLEERFKHIVPGR